MGANHRGSLESRSKRVAAHQVRTEELPIVSLVQFLSLAGLLAYFAAVAVIVMYLRGWTPRVTAVPVWLILVCLVLLGFGVWVLYGVGAGPDRNSELGAALLGGTVVAIAVLYAERIDSNEAERRNLRFTLSSQRNLSGIDLQRRNLRHVYLGGRKNLTDAKLNGARLNGAVLRQAILNGADLRNADLTAANLFGANLAIDVYNDRRAILRKTILRGANLEQANLQGADMIGADLHDANLRQANLRSALLLDATGLKAGQLEEADGNVETLLPDGLDPPSWWETTEDGLLKTGRSYSSKVLRPALTLEVAEESWRAAYRTLEGIGLIHTATGEDGVCALSFLSVQRLWDPKHPILDESVYRTGSIPVPEGGVASWLRDHTRLDIVELTDGHEVDGITGAAMRIAAKPNQVAKIPLFLLSSACKNTSWFSFDKGNNYYVITLTINEENVVIVVESSTDKFETFYPKAREILQAVKWERKPAPAL